MNIEYTDDELEEKVKLLYKFQGKVFDEDEISVMLKCKQDQVFCVIFNIVKEIKRNKSLD